MEKSEIKYLINTIFSWGLGGVMLILGTLLMIFHKTLNIDFPIFLYAGLIIDCFGFAVWFITQLFNYKLKIKNNVENK